MKALVNILPFNRYEVNTIENENQITILIWLLVCFCCAVVNGIYFTIVQPIELQDTLLNSSILFVFGIIYLLYGIFSLDENKKAVYITITSAVLTIFVVLRYYSLIGPVVWTYSFIVIVVSMLRENIKTLSLFSTILFFLGIYVWYSDIDYTFNQNYYIAQFIALSILFIVSSVVFLNNKKKNIKISEQLHDLKTLANNLKKSNTLLEEEISEHQKTISMLHDSEQRFKSIVYALPDAVFKLDSQGTFIECESRDTSWLLLPKAEFINKRICDILPPNIAALSLEKIEMTLKTDQVQIMEYKMDEEGKDAFFEVRFIKANESEIYAILRNITETKQKQQMVEYLSYHDQLTGLYNRRFFEEEVKRLDTARNMPITIAMVDVNGLKLTNDAFGHLVGDQLLILVADILKRECRSDDIVARVGGDEFVILLPKTSLESAERIANRIYSAVDDAKLNQIDISVSIGWDTKRTSDQPMKELFIKAEESMYRKKLTESQSMRNNTIQVILKTLNEKNEREKVHSVNVSKLSKRIGEILDLDHETLKEIEIAGLMHDIGKIAIAECVLNKPGRLTEEEYEEIKRHPKSGYQILRSADAYSSLAEYVLSHHEKWDGTGYPRGLKGEEIPLISRIIAIADAYEAMTSERTYRKTMSSEEALDELKRYSGVQFDPNLVKVLRKGSLDLK